MKTSARWPAECSHSSTSRVASGEPAAPRSSILDNALIGFCKVELADKPGEQAIDMGPELSFRVPGLPPAKSEDLSMLGPGHSHAPRVLKLLRTAKDALERSDFAPVDGGPIALDVVVHAPPGQDP
jgi:hypothetical protein